MGVTWVELLLNPLTGGASVGTGAVAGYDEALAPVHPLWLFWYLRKWSMSGMINIG